MDEVTRPIQNASSVGPAARLGEQVNGRHDRRAAMESAPAADCVVEYERSRRNTFAGTDPQDRGVAALMAPDPKAVLIEHRLDRSGECPVVLDITE